MEYIQETKSGFRYRLLDGAIIDGYAAAVSQLLPGERLYRMMDGYHRVEGKLFPCLIVNKTDYDWCTREVITRGWRFKLAAGIPQLTQPDETIDPFAEMLVRVVAQRIAR